MALKDWKIVYKNVELSPTYYNAKIGQYIAIGDKSLTKESNFTQERYAFLVEESGYHVRYEKYFVKKEDAFKYLKEYMKTH